MKVDVTGVVVANSERGTAAKSCRGACTSLASVGISYVPPPDLRLFSACTVQYCKTLQYCPQLHLLPKITIQSSPYLHASEDSIPVPTTWVGRRLVPVFFVQPNVLLGIIVSCTQIALDATRKSLFWLNAVITCGLKDT